MCNGKALVLTSLKWCSDKILAFELCDCRRCCSFLWIFDIELMKSQISIQLSIIQCHGVCCSVLSPRHRWWRAPSISAEPRCVSTKYSKESVVRARSSRIWIESIAYPISRSLFVNLLTWFSRLLFTMLSQTIDFVAGRFDCGGRSRSQKISNWAV